MLPVWCLLDDVIEQESELKTNIFIVEEILIDVVDQLSGDEIKMMYRTVIYRCMGDIYHSLFIYLLYRLSR